MSHSLVGTSAGTILGPILFLAHVHDSPLCIQYKFANNFASVVSAENADKDESRLQDVLDEMATWTEKWDMRLNTSNTKVMFFGGKKANLSVTLFGKNIEQVSQMKYLGVWLDESLNFSEQAAYAASKATWAFTKIARLVDSRKGISLNTGQYQCCTKVSCDLILNFVQQPNFAPQSM